MLSIRAAGVADIPLVRALVHEFAEHELHQAVISEATLAEDGFGARPVFRVLLAEWGERVAGYALFYDCYSSFHGRGLFLEDLFVRADFRGKGTGRSLLAQCAAIAAREQCVCVRFNVLAWNDSAIEFYRKLGVTFLDDWKTISLEGVALHDLAKEAV